jgi:hypothetical protein
MKHTQSMNNYLRIWFILTLILVFNSCYKDPEGYFCFSDEAAKYQIDTNILSFKMVDNNGITDGFYLDQYGWYATHHYFYQWGDNGKAFDETFGVMYISSVSYIDFMFVLRAHETGTELEFEWNQDDLFYYNLDSEKITSGINPQILFYDSLQVKQTIYHDILEIDYSAILNKIHKQTPSKIYLAGKEGLIKYIRQDGIVYERVKD